MIKQLLIVLVVVNCQHSIAGHFKKNIVDGLIKSFDKKRVIIEDYRGQVYEVLRKDIISTNKLHQNQKVQFINKFTPPHKFDYLDLPDPVIRAMKIPALAKLHRAYVDFVIEYEKGEFTPHIPSTAEQVTTYFESYVLDVVYARNSRSVCFFGGWPSVTTTNNRVCYSPWNRNIKSKRQQMLSASGVKLESQAYKSCGKKGAIRCNPVLFGNKPKGNLIRNASGIKGTKGFCVLSKSGDFWRKSRYKNLSDTCSEVAGDNSEEIINEILNNEDKFNKFKNLRQQVLLYCDKKIDRKASKKGYTDPCTTLKKRIQMVMRPLMSKQNCQVEEMNNEWGCNKVLVKCVNWHAKLRGMTEDLTTVGYASPKMIEQLKPLQVNKKLAISNFQEDFLTDKACQGGVPVFPGNTCVSDFSPAKDTTQGMSDCDLCAHPIRCTQDSGSLTREPFTSQLLLCTCKNAKDFRACQAELLHWSVPRSKRARSEHSEASGVISR